MRSLSTLFGVALAITCHNYSNASVILFQQDTLNHDTICVTPYFAKTPVRSLGNFAFVKKDHNAFQTYAGFSALNTLRGHVPGLSISPIAYDVTAGLRSLQSMLVIDGLPYAGTYYSNYNLNAFDYENIFALSSGNAASLYGGLASAGGIFLQSKTGKNIYKPTFEFNTSPTLIWNTSGISGEQWYLANAVAYAQDYGVPDLRVSYNSTVLPPSTDIRHASGLHNIKVNSGFDFSKRFSMRLILDERLHKETDHDSYTFLNGQPVNSKTSALSTNWQGNLILRYDALDWLTLTSQSSLANLEHDKELRSTLTNQDEKQENQRAFINLFASSHQSLTKNIILKEFAGIQYERQEFFREMRQSSSNGATSGSYQEREYKTTSLLAGIGLQYDSYWYTNLNYRLDKYNSLYPNDDTEPTYALTSAFIFSDAFRWKSNWFSFGKLRGSFGKLDIASMNAYPYNVSLVPSSNVIPNPRYTQFTRKKMIETGVDLAFFTERLALSLSYFHDLNNHTFVNLPAPPGTGFFSTIVDIGELHTKGWEVLLSGKIIDKNTTTLSTSLTWANYKTYIRTDNNNGGNGSSGTLSPPWAGSILNQLNVKNFFVTMLVDLRSGTDYYTFDGWVEDDTKIKLRDISIGRTLAAKPDKSIIRQAQLSLSLRNLWTIHGHVEPDYYESFVYPNSSQKSVSISLMLIF